MKNFIISLLTVLLVFATSCNEMDQYPHNAVSSDNLTEEDAQLLLTGLYFYSRTSDLNRFPNLYISTFF